MMNKIRLKHDREKSLKRKHPWVFSGSVQEVVGNPKIGETVKVISSEGEEIGYGAYSPHSSIRVRMWNFDMGQNIDEKFISEKLRVAINLRNSLHIINPINNACRLINAESDGLPGLIVDMYSDLLSVQLLSAGPELWKDAIIKNLVSFTGIEIVFDRSDVEVR